MLLQFAVANHLSLRDRQELSLIASTLKDEDAGLLKGNGVQLSKVLPAVVIYGANASGKSNLVDAITFMRSMVLNSHRTGDPEGGVLRKPFLLEKEFANHPTNMDVDFAVERERYHYGFAVNDKEIVSEWLYSFPNERKQLLFRRDRQEFKFGRALKGRNKLIEDITRPNSLFVSAAAQNDHEQLAVISRFFRSMSIKSRFVFPPLSPDAAETIDERIIAFLTAVGTGVVGYNRKEVQLSEQSREFSRGIKDIIKKAVGNTLTPEALEAFDSKLFQVELGHKSRDGSVVFLDVANESDGTRRLLEMLGIVFRSLDDGAPVIIDELDASLHTMACEAVLSLFSSSKSNPKGAQLIATTHDTNLLCSRLLRRDQVWFTEKDSDGASHIFPLTDIHTRRGDNIEKGYLQGRFGAIPYAGSVTELLGGE